MNNIGLRPTFKKKKLSYIFHLTELGLSVYDWGKPCLLLILSPRLCLVCCFSVFVPTPSLWPKISFHHITRAGRGSSPLRLNQKLNSQWNDTLYRGLWRPAFLSLGQSPPRAPWYFEKYAYVQWRSQGLPGWASRPPGEPKWGRKWVRLRKNKINWSKFEEKMRKVEILPIRDCEAGYGPAYVPGFS